ncbi:MAG: hypothetical protein IIB44_01180 [Candidatus Marinimicrobia bacterium]|nr:hypothetical protein [Candidatus Neomarinimicrobiota bacterium]
MVQKITDFPLCIIVCFLFGVLGLHSLEAIPRFAVVNGTSCSTCHISPTGSGLRNDYGIAIFSMDELPALPGRKWTDESFSGLITDHLQLGADFRLQFFGYTEGDTAQKIAIFPMQSDIYGYIEVNRIMDVYVELDLIRNNSEIWTSLNLFPNDGYIRIGKKIPHYGLPLDDHTSFVRGGNIRRNYGLTKEGMPFSPFTPVPGMIEIGVNLSDFFLTWSISNGYVLGRDQRYGFGESISDKTVTGRIEYSKAYTSWSVLAGGSIMKEQDFSMWGLFGGVSRGNVSWEGEVDLAENWASKDPSLASYSQFSWQLLQGLHLLTKYDFFDLDVSRKGEWVSRFSGGIEFFPVSFLEIKAQVRVTNTSELEMMSKPEYLLQFHTWF